MFVIQSESCSNVSYPLFFTSLGTETPAQRVHSALEALLLTLREVNVDRQVSETVCE